MVEDKQTTMTTYKADNKALLYKSAPCLHRLGVTELEVGAPKRRSTGWKFCGGEGIATTLT